VISVGDRPRCFFPPCLTRIVHRFPSLVFSFFVGVSLSFVAVELSGGGEAAALVKTVTSFPCLNLC